MQPCVSYATLIAMAIADGPGKRRSINEIYDWMLVGAARNFPRNSRAQHHFPFFATGGAPSWKASVRHSLSQGRAFAKLTEERGTYWTLRNDAEPPRSRHRHHDAGPLTTDRHVR